MLPHIAHKYTDIQQFQHILSSNYTLIMMVFKKNKTLRFQVILLGRVHQSTAFLYFSALKFTVYYWGWDGFGITFQAFFLNFSFYVFFFFLLISYYFFKLQFNSHLVLYFIFLSLLSFLFFFLILSNFF